MRRKPGVELAGYLDAAVGVGEAARRYLGALRAVGVPVLVRDVPLPGRDFAMTELARGRRPSARSVRFNLFCLNPEQLTPYLASPHAPSHRNRTSVGIWSWEVDIVPPGWARAADLLSGIWTYSDFSARLISAAIGVPVVTVPLPLATHIVLPSPSGEPRPFTVLTMFDYLSTLERKNPLGAIAAYRRAFDERDGTQLIVKSLNGVHRPDAREEIEGAAAGRSDIVLRDGTLSGPARDTLVASCDCLLSLHRSEGFGLPLAEAMAAGKPVVATAYGGNTEFMTADNSYPVDYTLTTVGAGSEHYPPEATWAEPDIGHAADQLRSILDDHDAALERAKRAQVSVRRLLDPAVVGEQMRVRLESLSVG